MNTPEIRAEKQKYSSFYSRGISTLFELACHLPCLLLLC